MACPTTALRGITLFQWIVFLLTRTTPVLGNVNITVITTRTDTASLESPLTSLAEQDQLRLEHISMDRQGNLDVITTTTNDEQANVSLCHFATLLPLTTVQGDKDDQGDQERIPYTTLGSLQGVAALLLGLSHLNQGNGSIVPEIAEMPRKCPQLRFSTELLDSQLDERKAIDHVISQVQSPNPPCAFVGSYRSAVTMPTSIITGLQGYPQWAALSTSSALDDIEQFPLSGRLNPSDDGTAVAAILCLQQLNVNHLAVLHTNDAYGNAYVSGLIQAAALHAPSMQIRSVDLPFKATPQVLERRVQKLAQTGFRYFFGIIFDAMHYDPLMTEAVRQGIAGTGYHQWIFSDGVGVGRMTSAQHEPGSPLWAASQGTGMITAVGGLPSSSGEESKPYDRLAAALRRLDSDDLDYLMAKHPQYPNYDDKAKAIIQDPSFLQEPGLLAPFLYDTVVAMGLAACEVVSQGQTLSGPLHFAQTLQSNFSGTSGEIRIHPETGTRQATSALFSLTNFVVQENGSVKAVATDVFRDGAWTSLEPYTFNDGTTTAPLDLPPNELDANTLDTPARVLIWTLGCSSLALSVAFGVWTKIHSKDRVVKASQPIFLYIVCVGTFFMGLSVLLLGVDDGVFQAQACQYACLLFPWLLSMGFALTASALFTKTHRINVIVHQRQFRRVAVSPLDVMKPMFCLVGANAITLILWNVLDTAEWVRETTEHDAFGRAEQSVGYCSYEGALPYVITLSVCNVGAIILSLYEAYVARDVSTEYAESEYIAKSMATVLMVCFVGIPVAIMTQDHTAAFDCTIAGVVAACSLSFQLYIFVPKIKFNREAQFDDQKRPSSLRRTTQIFRSRSLRGTASSTNSENSSDDFGMRYVNRRLVQIDLESENQKLLKANKKLKKQIESLLQGSGGRLEKLPSRRSLFKKTPSQKSVKFDESSIVENDITGSVSNMSMSSFGSLVVSEAESIIVMDPTEHDDETNLAVAPF